MTRSPSVALLDSEAPPRVNVAPAATRENSWEDVTDLSGSFGVTLDEWQETVLQSAMGERKDGTWAAQRVGLSAPRQNGKSQLIVARALAGALLFGEKTIIISAHQQDTARETFGKFLEIIEASPGLEARLRGGSVRTGVMNALNREFIRFANGAKIQFKARAASGGRGFSADCLFLDEAQILSQRAWASINSTMSARPNPQIWLLGTPPTPEDDGEVFKKVRRTAMEGKSPRSAYLEWSDDGDPALESTRAKANPAWNTRINHDVVQGEFETYTPEQFRLERLGVWTSEVSGSRLISKDQWRARGVKAAPEGAKSFGVAFSLDGERVALAGARKHDEGIHVELIDGMTGGVDDGLDVLADWLAERWRDTALIVMSGRAGATVLHQKLRDRGVPERVLHVASLPDYTTSCSMLHEALNARTVTHLDETHLDPDDRGQRQLDDSVAVCDKKARGTAGAWGWEATTPDGDETPLEAVSLAHWGAKTTKRRPGRKQVVL